MTEVSTEFSVALAEAAGSYDFEGIASLVSQGAPADSALGAGTLLTWAVRQGQENLARHLVEAQANVDLGDAAGDTPLIHAAQSGLQDIAEILIDAGADPFLRNRAGKTAHEAALAAKSKLYEESDNPNADLGSIESLCGRLGRIALMLEEAGQRRAQENEIASCHAGVPGKIIIGQPLKFKGPSS